VAGAVVAHFFPPFFDVALLGHVAIIADSDDLARVYRFDLAQDSEMISPTIPI
jgi:hypothetical protein